LAHLNVNEHLWGKNNAIFFIFIHFSTCWAGLAMDSICGKTTAVGWDPPQTILP